MKQDNPFHKYAPTGTHKAFIKSLNYEIEFRKLTMAEDDEYNLAMMKGVNREDQTINVEAASEIKYQKIAKQLIDPKVTVKDLKSMEIEGSEAIVEVLQAIEGKKRVDDKGNLKS